MGFLHGNIRESGDAKVDDTVTLAERPCTGAVPGFREVKTVVFCGLYPSDPSSYEQLKFVLEKLQLDNAAFSWESEISQTLGFDFRCDFFGLLHMEVIQECLGHEFQVDLAATAPSVTYRVETTDGKTTEIDNPSKLPDPARITNLYEPYVHIDIHVPSDYVDNMMKFCEEKHDTQKSMGYLAQNRIVITYELPFAEIVFGFFGHLKFVTRGYVSIDREMTDCRASNLVHLGILLNGEAADALAVIVYKDRSYIYGHALVLRLKRIVPRQMFEVVTQTVVGWKVIAHEAISTSCKNVTAKCYGGDITHKRKLLEKQKEGKKRMERMGNVELPQEALLAILQVGDEWKAIGGDIPPPDPVTRGEGRFSESILFLFGPFHSNRLIYITLFSLPSIPGTKKPMHPLNLPPTGTPGNRDSIKPKVLGERGMGFEEGREKLLFKKVPLPLPNLSLLLSHQSRDLLPQDTDDGLGNNAVRFVLNTAHNVGGDSSGVGEIRQDKLREQMALQLLYVSLQLLQSVGQNFLLPGGFFHVHTDEGKDIPHDADGVGNLHGPALRQRKLSLQRFQRKVKHIRAVVGIGSLRGGFLKDLSRTRGDGRKYGPFDHLGGGIGRRCGFGGLSGNARRHGTKLRRKRFQLAVQDITFRKQRLDVVGDHGDVGILLSGAIRMLLQDDHPFIETAQGFL